MNIIVPEAPAYATGAAFHHFSLTSLALDGADRQAVETWAESYAPRIIDRSATYADMLDDLDGSPWIVGNEVRIIDLGDSFTDPAWKRLEGIVRRVVRDCRE
jgi:hypothetical protein